MKIVFIGDSHLVGLKKALSGNALNNHLFFGYPSCANVNMGMLAVNGQSLVPTNEKLKAHFKNIFHVDEIDLSTVDVVVLTGLRLEFPYKLLEKSNYSRQVLRQAMEDLISEHSLSLSLAEKIKAINKNIHVIVIPNPLITNHLKSVKIRSAPGIEPHTIFGKIDITSNNELQKWYVLLEKKFQHLGVRFCFQPRKTIIDGIFTRPEFAEDPLNIPPGIRHMNAKFWQQTWTDLNKMLPNHFSLMKMYKGVQL